MAEFTATADNVMCYWMGGMDAEMAEYKVQTCGMAEWCGEKGDGEDGSTFEIMCDSGMKIALGAITG